jgi:glycosyltransferase involved in cell wall biosynthesis
LKHHVFIIGAVWVEPKSSAAGSRMLQLIHTFLSQGWTVTFGTVSQKNLNSIDLTRLGVTEVSLELNATSFDDFIKEQNPSIVFFDRFITEEQFGWRVAEQCPNSLRVLDTEDLHSLRKTRHEAIKNGVEFSNDLLLNSDIAKREIAAIYRCDISLIISTFEMKLLQEVFKVDENLLLHLPFFLDQIDEKKQDSWKSFEERNHFISIGNFLHAPNLDATIQLKKHIWKLIRKRLPEAELHIYGAYPTQQVVEFHNIKEGFFVHGFAEDAHKVIGTSKVLLAPLRFGAGIKGKLTDAMLNGTPSVTTNIGVEGMSGELPWNGFVAGEFEEFVDKAVKLYTNEEVWNQAQQNGIEIINTLYNKGLLERGFLGKIQNLHEDLYQHRNENFIGKMLLHHSLQSSKYMSKWIEEKNKK